MAMTDIELADELITRLNKLIEHPDVRQDISALLAVGVPCSEATIQHPTLQVGWATKEDFAKQRKSKLGLLGFLNGLVGVFPDGSKKDWGLITVNCEEVPGGLLLKSFSRTINNTVVEPFLNTSTQVLLPSSK